MDQNSYVFELGHPKHYHMFKGYMDYYNEIGKKVTVIARDKDVLLKLLKADGREYNVLGPHKDGLFKKLAITPILLFNYIRILRQTKPSIIFSKASPYASVFSKLLGINHIMFPDSDGFKSNDVLMKFSKVIVTPDNYRNDYGTKHKKVSGFFENIYLHPEQFHADPVIVKKYSINPDRKYTIVRFVGWGAHHDGSDSGFSLEDKLKLVKRFEKYGDVYITSEKPLEGELEKYRLRIDPVDIHHVLYFASLYIGDSQSMATEASLLGVPSIRSNSFVGDSDMSNFKLLEEEFGLLFNYSDPFKALEKGEELLSDNSSKEVWRKKREAYYAGDRNVFQQIVEIVDEID